MVQFQNEYARFQIPTPKGGTNYLLFRVRNFLMLQIFFCFTSLEQTNHQVSSTVLRC